MKKLFFTLCLIAASFGSLMAGPVDQQKAQQLGTKFLSVTAAGQRDADLQLNLVSVATDLERGGIDYYAFNVRGGEGFVIVSGDDCVKPILAYATTGTYDPTDVADGFAYILNSFRDEIHYVRSHNLSATPDIIAEWKSVSESGRLKADRKSRAVVGPLCQTIWNQNYPWNSQCPEDEIGSGGHVYAGCVATAMGQVMKFWDWPAQGQGSYSYNPSGYPQQSANFGETEYHFELMPLTLDSTSTDEQVFYIAQLLHHCGIATDMQYSGEGSGTYSELVPYAISNYFHYTSDQHISNWWQYNNTQWADMLKAGGLDEGMPLYYSGQDDSGAGGHAFVCDGYDENNYFHFNWGWSGRDDAWCPIGALNTTRYAFNTLNGFTGHIQPAEETYFNRPDSINDMQAVEKATLDGVILSWTNPTTDLNGNALTSLNSVTVMRNFEEVAVLTNVEVGAAMTYDDTDLAPGLYEYEIFATNEAGDSRFVSRSLMVGQKCDVTFQLHDAGGNGWKGAAISVTDANGIRIAVVTMTEGSEQTVTLPLLRGNLSFIWNHGWYHAYPEHDTDSECSFSILDFDGNVLYTSTDLEDGVFLTYENNCEAAPLACYPVRNLEGEYLWNEADDYGAAITWDAPEMKTYLSHFRIVRTTGAYKDEVLLAEIAFDGSEQYTYFDNTANLIQGDTYYSVNSVYIRGEEQCESEYEDVMINITDVEENGPSTGSGAVAVYPNPTNELLTVEGQGTMHISVSNLLGQKLMETSVEGNTTLDLGRFGKGLYLVRIETENEVSVHKVNVK